MKKSFKKTPKQFLKEKLVDRLKKIIKETPNSVLFWNGLLYVLFFSVWIFADIWYIAIIACIGSLLYAFTLLECLDDEDLHLWPPLTILFWVVALYLLSSCFLDWLWSHIIVPFNAWLDKSKQD